MSKNTVLRDYKILQKIGEGGMGSVYLAEDTMLDRKVAVKILNPILTQDEQFTSRFRQEAKVQASLIHPNVVAMYNFFLEGDNYCMVMEYADGETLKELIRRIGPIPEHRALKIFRQMLEGVGYAHSKGIIHRDIKPSNIIVDRNDNVKVMDFGIAKIMGDRGMTKTGMKMGTVLYMSPEQIRAEKDIDQRTDIYSLGITLYEMLAGRVPYNTETDSDFELMQEIVSREIKDPREFYPSISQNTIDLIFALTDKYKQKRIQSIKECNEIIEKKSSERGIDTLLKRNNNTSSHINDNPKNQSLNIQNNESGKQEVLVVKKNNVFKYLFAATLLILISTIIYLTNSNNIVKPHQEITQVEEKTYNPNRSLPNESSESNNNVAKETFVNQVNEQELISEVQVALEEWNNSVERFDFKNHIKYYAEEVNYFKMNNLPINKIIREKESFFNSGAWTCGHNTMSDVSINYINEDRIISNFNYDCEFIKNTGRVYSVNVDKKIIWQRINGDWKIKDEKDVKVWENRSHK